MGVAVKPKTAAKPKPANLKPRYEPPTLEEAFFAAEGLTDDRDQQVVIAAELMEMPTETVAQAAQAYFKAQAKRVTVEAAHRPGAEIIVEHRSAPMMLQRRSATPAFSFERKPAGSRFVVETRAKRVITLPR